MVFMIGLKPILNQPVCFIKPRPSSFPLLSSGKGCSLHAGNTAFAYGLGHLVRRADNVTGRVDAGDIGFLFATDINVFEMFHVKLNPDLGGQLKGSFGA